MGAFCFDVVSNDIVHTHVQAIRNDTGSIDNDYANMQISSLEAELQQAWIISYPFGEADETAAGGLQQHCAPERRALEAEVTERRVELDAAFRQCLHLAGYQRHVYHIESFNYPQAITLAYYLTPGLRAEQHPPSRRSS